MCASALSFASQPSSTVCGSFDGQDPSIHKPISIGGILGRKSTNTKGLERDPVAGLLPDASFSCMSGSSSSAVSVELLSGA